MIHMTGLNRNTFRHDDCGWGFVAWGDNFCGGCGADFRRWWPAVRLTLSNPHTHVWTNVADDTYLGSGYHTECIICGCPKKENLFR